MKRLLLSILALCLALSILTPALADDTTIPYWPYPNCEPYKPNTIVTATGYIRADADPALIAVLEAKDPAKSQGMPGYLNHVYGEKKGTEIIAGLKNPTKSTVGWGHINWQPKEGWWQRPMGPDNVKDMIPKDHDKVVELAGSYIAYEGVLYRITSNLSWVAAANRWMLNAETVERNPNVTPTTRQIAWEDPFAVTP